MKFLDALNWIERSDIERKFTIHELLSDSKFELSNTVSEEELVFEVLHPHTKLFNNIDSEFIISDGFTNIKINYFRNKLTQNLLSRRIEAYIYETREYNKVTDFYYKLLSPIKDSFYLVTLLQRTDKDIYHFKVDGKSLKLSIQNSSKKKYLIIESISKLNFLDFKHLCNSILFSLGFFSGKLIKEEEMFFQTEDKSWDNCNGFFYRRLNKSINCYKPISSMPEEYSNFINNQEYDYTSRTAILETNKLEALVNLIYKNNNFFSSIRVLLEIFNNSFIVRPSILYIALETLCEEISKSTSSDFVEKQRLKNIGLSVLENNKSNIDIEDYSKLFEVINKVDNKFLKNIINYQRAFNGLQIELSNNDIKCLEKRNDHFHGRIVSSKFENEEGYVQLELDNYYLSQRLYTLISKLILKYIGYSGYIINHQKLREKQVNEEILDEDYFIKI